LPDGVSAPREARAICAVIVLTLTLSGRAALGCGLVRPFLAALPDRAQKPTSERTPRCTLGGLTFCCPARSTQPCSAARPGQLGTLRGRRRGGEPSLLTGPLLTLLLVALLLLRALALVRIRVDLRAHSRAQRESQGRAQPQNDGSPDDDVLL